LSDAENGRVAGTGTAEAVGAGGLPVSPSAAPAVLRTRRVRLRPIAEQDLVFLYGLMTSPHAGGRVRYAGATPSPEKVTASLWESVLAQFIIEGTGARALLGVVAITSPNFRDGYAYLSAIGTPEAQGSGLIAEGALLGYNYGFTTWPFRKIYMEATEDSYAAFRSGLGRYFREEGRLRQHAFWNGRYVDVLILAVYRQTWVEHQSRVMGRLGAQRAAATAAPDRSSGQP
jgi:RimJ/RimL family protein N-acetyltransferase